MATAIQGLSKANRKVEDSDGVGLARDKGMGQRDRPVRIMIPVAEVGTRIAHHATSNLTSCE
jgi:hypothetical protein